MDRIGLAGTQEVSHADRHILPREIGGFAVASAASESDRKTVSPWQHFAGRSFEATQNTQLDTRTHGGLVDDTGLLVLRGV